MQSETFVYLEWCFAVPIVWSSVKPVVDFEVAWHLHVVRPLRNRHAFKVVLGFTEVFRVLSHEVISNLCRGDSRLTYWRRGRITEELVVAFIAKLEGLRKSFLVAAKELVWILLQLLGLLVLCGEILLGGRLDERVYAWLVSGQSAGRHILALTNRRHLIERKFLIRLFNILLHVGVS